MKTTIRDNCKAEDQCPDHCTAFALSDPADADYCTDCSFDHNISFNDCEALKEAIQIFHSAIGKYCSKIINKDKEDGLRHDALVTEEKVKEWMARIMRARDEEKCKQSIPHSFLEDKVFILSDWAMKFFANKVSRKEIRVVSKERHMQCHCQERRGARILLLRSPVEQ